jgi:hypothetical protein
MGTSTSGHLWTSDGGTWGIISNTAYCPTLSGGVGRTTVDYGNRDCTLQVTISTVARPFGVWLGYDGVDLLTQIQIRCFIIATIHRTQFSLLRNGETTIQLITVDGVVWGNGDVLKVVLSGNSLDILRNGSSIGSTTDSRIGGVTGTHHGLRAETTAVRFDDFSITP